MLNSRSIPPELWEQARRALVLYFSRRHGLSNAEDLAQDTLTAILSRDDFPFEKEDQFLRVCYGFASRISLHGYRQTRKYLGTLDPATPTRDARIGGLSGVEVRVFAGEVFRAGQFSLTDQEWALVERLVDGGCPGGGPFGVRDANRARVRLHRIRTKLARLTGWRRASGNKKV